MNFMPLYLSRTPRFFHFPLPVSCVGRVVMDSQRYRGRHDGELEFCLRLSSEEPLAKDMLEGKVYENRFPHLFIKRGGVLHEYEYSRSREAFFIIYDPALAPVLESMGFPLGQVCREFVLTPEISDLMRKVLALFPESQFPGTADRIDLLCCRILTELFLSFRTVPMKEGCSFVETKIRRIASYLHLHYNKEIPWENLFRENGLSRRTFFRSWKNCYGEPPGKYVADLKMLEAVRLLDRGDLSVSEIAEVLCFGDSAYFIRAFRKRYKMTPLQYRKRGEISAKPDAAAP